MKKSVARQDDGVHSFFASSARKIAESLMDAEFLKKLRGMFAPGHRERRFNLATLVWLGIFGAANATLRSMEAILAAAAAAVEGGKTLPLRRRTLTESGWSRAKARLPLGLLRRLWRRWVEVARLHAGDKALYHGMRLVALDKKTMNVPEALWPTFRSHRGGRGEGPAQAELLVAYDVCVRVPLELTLGRVREDERKMASCLLRKLPAPSLLLVDCGFYSFVLFAEILHAGHHFLTRMRVNGTPRLLRRFRPTDGLYTIRPGNLPKEERDPSLPDTLVVRIVQTQRRGFRPIRLVTSLLDPDAFPREEILDLYHDRWHIETFFRELTGDVAFESWHTRTLRGLYVELLFTMTYVTVVRAHLAEAGKDKPLRPGRLSFGRGAEACLRAWCRLPKSASDQVPALRQELLTHLATLLIDVRPGRRFERDTQKRRAASRQKKLQALEAKRHAA